MAAESKWAVVAALVANLVIAVMKLVASVVSGSSAMLAEAMHSFSDVGNQVLLLVGIHRAEAGPSARYPYGRGKAAFFWPFLVAVLLFGVAGGFSFFEGIEKLRHPEPLHDIKLGLAVLGVAFVIEMITLIIAVRAARIGARRRGIGSVREFLTDNRDATLLTVLVEDGLAVVGLPVAATAILLSRWTGNAVWDGIGSMVIGAMLMGFALFLGAKVRGLLLGLGLSDRDLSKVHSVLGEATWIETVIDVSSMYVGSAAVLVGIEIDVRDDLTGAALEGHVDALETRLREVVPELRYIYIEPRAVTSRGA